MDEQEARQAVADVGRMLLREGLVVRTWGNMSCRIDDNTFAITPSGLGYEGMTADDVVVFDRTDETWRGIRKPSSEKGVHIAAYKEFPDAGFVIHTHQVYASALGLAGFDELSPMDEEKNALGGVALAKYGPPGTKHLTKNVAAALHTGAHTVLMAQHGALIVGSDLSDACFRAKLLETVCQRACKGQPEPPSLGDAEKLAQLAEYARRAFLHVTYTVAPAVRETAKSITSFRAQLDDMAQLIGPKLIAVNMETGEVMEALQGHNAVLVSHAGVGIGAICRADTQGDCDALRALVEKACIGFLHTRALGVSAALSPLDAMLMRMVYTKKYSKKIGS